MGTKLYVGNLSFNVTESDLRAAFESDGRQVREVVMVSDRETGRPRGFGFVQMASEKDAQAAIAALDGKEIDGRAVKVSEAQEKPRPGMGGGGFGGGRSGGGGGRSGGGGGGGRDRRY